MKTIELHEGKRCNHSLNQKKYKKHDLMIDGNSKEKAEML